MITVKNIILLIFGVFISVQVMPTNRDTRCIFIVLLCLIIIIHLEGSYMKLADVVLLYLEKKLRKVPCLQSANGFSTKLVFNLAEHPTFLL